jgi:predicted RNase H-like nuclease (RuvC/YqgF family)
MGQQLTNTLVDSSDMARVLEHAQQEAAAANTAGEMAVAYYTNAMTTLEGQLKSEKARSAELQQDKVRLQLEVAALKAQLDTAQAANKTQKTATSESAVQCDQGDGPLTTWLPMFKLG